MTLEEMVDNKHTVKLRWSEPWTATDQQGNEFTAVVELHATVSDCIGMARAYAKSCGRPTDGAGGHLPGRFHRHTLGTPRKPDHLTNLHHLTT